MTKFIATVSITALIFISALGNYWFTFGLWPKSWVSFFGFLVIGVILQGMLQFVVKDK